MQQDEDRVADRGGDSRDHAGDEHQDVDSIRFAAGRELSRVLFDGAPAQRRLPREMVRHTMAHLFGDVWQDDRLSLDQRSLITCAVLAALGRDSELRLHLRGARNLGLADDAIEAMLIHVAHYAGWPAGASGLRLLDEVREEMEAVADP